MRFSFFDKIWIHLFVKMFVSNFSSKCELYMNSLYTTTWTFVWTTMDLCDLILAGRPAVVFMLIGRALSLEIIRIAVQFSFLYELFWCSALGTGFLSVPLPLPFIFLSTPNIQATILVFLCNSAASTLYTSVAIYSLLFASNLSQKVSINLSFLILVQLLFSSFISRFTSLQIYHERQNALIPLNWAVPLICQASASPSSSTGLESTIFSGGVLFMDVSCPLWACNEVREIFHRNMTLHPVLGDTSRWLYSCFYCTEVNGWNELKVEWVLHFLQASISMVLHCTKGECIDHMSPCAFVE